jgi:hypothetical protein
VRRAALVIALLAVACAAVYARSGDVRVDACVMIATDRQTDSLYVLLYRGACRPNPDTAMGWRVPSLHEHCDMGLVIDGTLGRMADTWPRCGETPKRGEGG